MRVSRRLIPALLVLAFAVSAFGATLAADLTLPVWGRVALPELTYTPELTITNHRDVRQTVLVDFISNLDLPFDNRVLFTLEPRQTIFVSTGMVSNFLGNLNGIGALRFRAIGTLAGLRLDEQGQLEVRASILALRGRFGFSGTSRQEVETVPSSEYTAREAVFVGVRHDGLLYTNVGIVNMGGRQEKFFVRFEYLDEVIEVNVPPMSIRQFRLPGPGTAGRWVSVVPEWATTTTEPARTSPWVAYTSSVDPRTGDAFSGVRVPSNTTFQH